MKTKKIVQNIMATLLCLGLAITSCKKNKSEEEVTPESTTGSLMFHLHTMADTNEVEAYGDTVVLTGGKRMAVNMAQLYISNIKLIKTDGSVVDGPSAIVLMKQGVEEYELGPVTAGNYKAIRFDVGLSDAINATNPQASSNINLYQNSMWFDSSTAMANNYVFVNFQGLIDTTSSNLGSSLIPFEIRIGTNARRVTVTMPNQNFTITPGQLAAVHMSADYAKLFDGVQLNMNTNLTLSTAAQNANSIASQYAANISNMFKYE